MAVCCLFQKMDLCSQVLLIFISVIAIDSGVSTGIERYKTDKNAASERGFYGTGSRPDVGCTLKVDLRSITYFRSRLQIADPNFIRFEIHLNGTEPEYIPSTSEAVNPIKWVWTYKSSRGLYPYLHWNVDYHVLSFDLLDAKTLWTDPYILFHPHGHCNLTLGTRETVNMIAEQLTELVSQLSDDNKTITKYQESYWCYLAEAPGFRDTIGYYLGLYFVYPANTINYNCCHTLYDYTNSTYSYFCMDEQIRKWVQCTIGPYVLGILLFLFSPFILLKITSPDSKQGCAKHAKEEENNERTPLIRKTRSNSLRLNSVTEEAGEDWLYLDGTFPISFVKLFSSLFPTRYPVALSRFKRFIFILFSPTIVYVQVGIYKAQLPEMTTEFVERGVPIGFLSLLGNSTENRRRSFVPALGGPISLLMSYYVLGLLFLVLPKSIQDVLENGIPRLQSDVSPLGLNFEKIKILSNIQVHDKRGFRNAANVCLCSFYMSFTGDFWKTVFKIQYERVRYLSCFRFGICKCIGFVFLPLYVVVCIIEILCCLVYFLTPLCSFTVIIVRGAVRTIAITIRDSRHSADNSIVSKFMKNQLVIAIFSLVVATMFIFYVYSFCLVFIQSFYFISQILVFCYVAVIVFPAVAFGYLFFGVVLLYYIFRLIRGFGVKYLDLLNDVVEISMNMEEQDNYMSVFDGNLVISNVKLSGINRIKINDTVVPVAQNLLQGIKIKTDSRLSFRDNTYGIKEELFNYVVRKHMPVHQQVLKVVFHLSMICLFLSITISLTAGFITGPTSEISDVMHVIFIVTVGALPRVLEVALLDSSEQINRDIKLRRLEETVNRYWQKATNQTEESSSSVGRKQVLTRHLSLNM